MSGLRRFQTPSGFEIGLVGENFEGKSEDKAPTFVAFQVTGQLPLQVL